MRYILMSQDHSSLLGAQVQVLTVSWLDWVLEVHVSVLSQASVSGSGGEETHLGKRRLQCRPCWSLCGWLASKYGPWNGEEPTQRPRVPLSSCVTPTSERPSGSAFESSPSCHDPRLPSALVCRKCWVIGTTLLTALETNTAFTTMVRVALGGI